MIEITILIDEDKLLELFEQKLKDKGYYDDDLNIYYEYIEQLVNEGLFESIGTFNLDDWLDDLIDRTLVVYPRDSNYDHVKDLYDSEDFEDRNMVVHLNFKDLYLVEFI